MKLNEQIRQDRERFSKLPDRQSKLHFLWDYYKIPIIAVLSVLFIFVFILSTDLKRSDVSLYAVLINNDSLVMECDDTVFDRLIKEGGYDAKGKTADINDRFFLSMENNDNEDAETLQVLSAMFALDEIDLFVADQEHFDLFGKEGAFTDLSTIIPIELQQKHEDMLYRYQDSNGNTVLGGILLKTGSPLHEAGYYHNEVILGMAANCGNPEAAEAVIKAFFK
ncbi:MAG: hypothetical protein IKS69_01740 [Erysipelotrichaceae bacterium]|nr:hypothetical protein [Erysipelotrichaceae bacterium]